MLIGEDVETGDGTDVLKLSGVAIDGDSDDGVGDLLAEVSPSGFLISPRAIADISSRVNCVFSPL